MRIEFRILGPLELSAGGRVLPLGSPKQRALLALLLVHANETVSRDRLIEELWGDAAPASVESAVHVYLSRLRRLLDSAGGTGLLVRQAHGYRLRVEPDRLDATRFAGLAREGREALAAGEAERAADRLRRALALWRGPALADLESERFAIAAAARLEEGRVSALEQRLEADLALSRDQELIGELETLVAEHPYRERLHAQLILALYRSGRQAEALRAYQQARRTLADELGLKPGHELQELEQAILRQDPTLTLERPTKLRTEPPPSPPPLASVPASREERKVVTALFADLVGFTAQAEPLDPGSLLGARANGDRAPWRHGREIRWRRGDGAVRRPAGTRGRPRARGQSRPGDPRLGARARAARGTHRCDDRRGARAARSATTRRRRCCRRRRHQQRRSARGGCAGERDPCRRDDLPRHSPRHRLSRGESGGGEGKGRSDSSVGGDRAPVRAGRRRGSSRTHAAHRARPGAHPVAEHGAARARRSRAAARDARRRAGYREESSHVRALQRACCRQRGRVAPGPLPSVWRRHRVLGDRRDRQVARANLRERRGSSRGGEAAASDRGRGA